MRQFLQRGGQFRSYLQFSSLVELASCPEKSKNNHTTCLLRVLGPKGLRQFETTYYAIIIVIFILSRHSTPSFLPSCVESLLILSAAVVLTIFILIQIMSCFGKQGKLIQIIMPRIYCLKISNLEWFFL